MSRRTPNRRLLVPLAGMAVLFGAQRGRAGDGPAHPPIGAASASAGASASTGEAPSAPAPPASASSNAPASDFATEEARKHFRTGVKLYNDGNYDGARAEFEAAYALKPGASSLQNIALCLKARFRYVEARDTLTRLLDVHGASLSDPEKLAVQTAIGELDGVIGTIALDVSPADAAVSFDGSPVTSAQRGALRANVGEHTLDAKASGYDALHKVIRVVGGQNARIALALRPSAAFVEVVADDPDAAIAIDGTGLAFAHWSGPLSPGHHTIQVYKEGYEPFEQGVWLEVGQRLHIDGKLGPKDDSTTTSEAPSKPGSVPSPPQLAQRGYYALLTLSAVGLDEAPQDLNIDRAKNTAGGSIGVRAGYRLWTPIGAEFVLEGGQHSVPDACETSANPCPSDSTRSYTLNSLRIGGAVRLMSSGSRIRFTSALGTGAVRHKLQLDPLGAKAGGTAEGFDPFFMAELGAQYNAGHVLLELDLVAFLDGASGLHGTLDGQDKQVFGNSPGALPMLGAGLRVGWGEWKP